MAETVPYLSKSDQIDPLGFRVVSNHLCHRLMKGQVIILTSETVLQEKPLLRGQVAIVTGAGRGIGRAIALALAAARASTAVIARSEAELDQTVRLIERVGGRAQAFVTDVTDAVTVRTTVKHIEESLGPVSLLVNNAAIGGPIGPFWETSANEWSQALRVNLCGPVFCSHAVLPRMIERHQGRIVNIASSAIPVAYFSGYATSKTALIRFTETVAAELMPHGVKMFALAPGTVRTSLSEHSLNSAEGQRWLPWFRRIFDEGLDVPAERPARMVLELASGRADILSGRLLAVSDDLDALLQNEEMIRENNLLSLRVRTLDSYGGNAVLASIRAQAECAQPLTVCVERTIHALPDKVFHAWIDPKEVEKWFVHDAQVHWNHRPTIDAKVDGQFSWSVVSDDNPHEKFAFHGTYREIEPGSKLAFTWEWQALPIEGVNVPGKTLVTVRFIPQGESTRVVLIQMDLPNESASKVHDKGWRRCLEGIAGLISQMTKSCTTFDFKDDSCGSGPSHPDASSEAVSIDSWGDSRTSASFLKKEGLQTG